MRALLRFLLIGTGVFALGLFPALFPPLAHAADLTVTTTADSTTTDGACSLREAITNANDDAQTFPDCAAGSGLDIIYFDIPATDAGCSAPNLCTISISGISTPLPNIASQINIDGVFGNNNITVRNSANNRVFAINSAGSLVINGLTIENGQAGLGFVGGGIFNNGGTLYVNGSTFIDNIAVSGSHIGTQDGTTTISNSTFFSSADVFAAISSGPDIVTPGSLEIYNSTIYGNNGTLGVGVAIDDGSGFMQNTIVANFPEDDCVVSPDATFVVNFFNFATDASCDAATQTTTANLNLGPLQDNGYKTHTMALMPGSVALDAGDNSVCAALPVGGFDQRSVTRPVGTFCDSGAYERENAQTLPGDLTVTQTADTDDGVCGPLYCTLREAINAANANTPVADTILFAIPSTNPNCTIDTCTITLEALLPTITDDVTMSETAGFVILNGNAQFRILDVASGQSLSVSDLTFTNGYCTGCTGGAIHSAGPLTLTNTEFLTNSVESTEQTGAAGGAVAIVDGATLEITNSTFGQNSAVDTFGVGAFGGAIYNAGQMTLSHSTFFQNQATTFGGAIANGFPGSQAQHTISNSTFTENGSNQGGAIFNVNALAIYNTTIANNSANVGEGAGIMGESNTATLYNTIIAGGGTGGDCSTGGAGSIVADSFNLDTDGTCDAATETTYVALNLGSLQNNGGPTETMALGAGSSALNVGDNAVCAAAPVNALDQRYIVRPQMTTCDVGAYEREPTTAANLAAFTGKLKQNDTVLKWRTTTESQIAGFNLWRRAGKNKWKKMNTAIIQAKTPGDVQGNKYRVRDTKTKPNKAHRYKLQVVYLDNHTEWSTVVKLKRQD